MNKTEPKYCQHRAEIDAAWRYIESAYEIESRDELEAAAKVNGFQFGLVQAMHHIWKRDPKVEALQTQLAAAQDENARYKRALEGKSPEEFAVWIDSVSDNVGEIKAQVQYLLDMKGQQ